MKMLILLSFMITSAFAAVNKVQVDYYGPDFYSSFPKNITKDSLFKILDKEQVSVSYEEARRIIFGELFIEKGPKGSFVKDVYCDELFYFRTVDEVANRHSEINIEHTWPQSRFATSFKKDVQKTDMHHLYPTDSEANSKRANHEFGNVGDSQDELNVKDCNESRLSRKSGDYIFSPPVEHRGNVARSLFYFATKYKLTISKAEETSLREWHKNDPVDDAERARHEIIVKYQKVRNPFVDHPELVDTITDF